MHRPLPAILGVMVILVAGCSSLAPSPSAPPSLKVSQRPLPAEVAGIPDPGDPSTEITPQTPSGELEVGVARDLTLGHCGLISPIDMDGSLWDPIGGHDGSGGGLTEDQLGELINATPVVVFLSDPNTAELRTPLGAVITLARHDGPRLYALCD